MCDARHLESAKCNRGERNLILHILILSLLLCLAGLTTACGTLSQTANTNSANSPSTLLSLTPGNATVAAMQQLQFTAKISGTANTAVTWSASAGSISSSGLFIAPQVASNTTVVVTATSAAHPLVPVGRGSSYALVPNDTNPVGVNSHASATVTVTAPATPATLAITNSALPAADAKVPYSASLSASGGVAPYQWSLASGTLPSGIQLQTSNGVIAGVTALTGSYPLTAKVTDAAGHSAAAALTLSVSSASGGSGSGFDGPAELPRVYIQSAMSNTPAPANNTTISSGGDLQSALNNANCGDTIQLQAGATFTGAYTFPAKSCDDSHWITVRTSADDSALPAEGSRLTPCYAGVSSLPGRPAFNCASTKNVLAKLMLPTSGNGPIIFASGATHYRLIGLEITRAPGSGIVYALTSVVNGGTADNVILDRVWMHGTAQDETNRGVWLQGTTYFSVIDSYLTDFHCISVTGVCTDAQAIAGGLGSGPMGPYKITDNFLEASGENILLGGGSATATPTDIQITRNHMFKPLTWLKGQPGFVGGTNGRPFLVKNLLELKNAQRVLIDSNIMENTWGGFSQVGFGVLLTPKNQAGANNSNLCPICQVTDVTIRYSTISHVGSGLQIANALAGTGAGLDGERYSIHDIVIDDIDGVKFDGPSEFAQVSVTAGDPLLQNVWIDHVTAFPTHTLFIIGNMVATSGPMSNFVFANSIVNAGQAPVWSTGGGPTNCAYYDMPRTTFDACFTNSAFTADAIIGASSNYPPANWPSGNYFPASATNVQFVNYNGGIGGDYRLQSSSPYKGKGTDGKDLGADIDAVNSAIAGVQ
jgi:Putative Ig domain